MQILWGGGVGMAARGKINNEGAAEKNLRGKEKDKMAINGTQRGKTPIIGVSNLKRNSPRRPLRLYTPGEKINLKGGND